MTGLEADLHKKTGPEPGFLNAHLVRTIGSLDQAFVVLVCFSIRLRAVSSSFLPSKPFLFMSSTHSTSTVRDLRPSGRCWPRG